MTETFLTREQVDSYHKNGYLVFPGFKTAAACDQLRQRMDELIDGFDPESHGSIFTTDVDAQNQRDNYFLESAAKIHFFYEEDAFDESGSLVQDFRQSINKVGHNLHDLEPVFDAFSRDPRMKAITQDLAYQDALLIQSMYIFKQPRIGGDVRPHQDSSYLYTEPDSTMGFWFALEDATKENGCLWVYPGGHKGPLSCRFISEATGNRHETLVSPPWPDEDWVPLEVAKGSMVCFHGYLPHKSLPNRSGKSRHAYTVHVVDGACEWLAGNWLQRPADNPPRGF